jgi:hypothetical protein
MTNIRTFKKSELALVLKEFFPFINPIYLPIKMNKNPALHIFKNEKTVDNFFTKNDLSDNQPDTPKNEEFVDGLLGKKRRKFDYIYDYLLMIGLTHHGKRNIEIIQRLWLDSKSVPEIRHRIKNLTCHKAPNNIIKKYKYYCDSPLSKVIINNIGRIYAVFERNTMVWL